MPLIVTLLAAALALGVWAYVLREGLGGAGVGLAAVRTVGIGLLALLLVNPSWLGEAIPGQRTVLLDRSLSLDAVGGQWASALDTAMGIAGSGGRMLGFGASVGPVADTDPHDGDSRLREALTVARGLGGPITVVTDGELTDLATVPPSLLRDAELVVLPRHAVPGAALLHVDAPAVVGRDDSIVVSVVIGAWGELAGPMRLEVLLGERRLRSERVDLPPPPTTVRRTILLPPRSLAPGSHAVAFRVAVDADPEPRDNVRLRAITVVAQAPIVVILNPPDWDGRVLARTVADVSGVPVRSFARVTDDSWIDMRSGAPVTVTAVREAVSGASLVMARGGIPGGDVPAPTPIWRWSPDGGLPQSGDWYVAGTVPSSPLVADLARVAWDSLAPLLSWRSPGGGWAALSAREGRRGVARPVVVGSTTAGRRELVTGGDGFYRWVLRGGAGLEAFRTLVAAGTDWLLASDRLPRRNRLETTSVVQRGTPVTFRWTGASRPDSLALVLESATVDTVVVLRFDADGTALLQLDPGVYRWRWEQDRGMTAVEEFSDEWLPRDRVVQSTGPIQPAIQRAARPVRQRWWVFGLVIVVFVVEWAWRQRRGLP